MRNNIWGAADCGSFKGRKTEMAGSGEFFPQYSQLPPEVQGNVMKQMDPGALRGMRVVSRRSRYMADFELKRRRQVAAEEYAGRVGEMPPEQMPYEDVVAANKLRVVEASSYSSFLQQLPPINPDDEADILLRLPEGTGVIGENAFRRDHARVGLEMPARFYAKVYISHVHFPLGLQKIDDFAFSNDLLFSQLYFPETLEDIGEGAFMEANISGTLRFPKSLTSIGPQAFAGCENRLTRIEFAEGSNVAVGEEAFAGVLATVHVPATASLRFFEPIRYWRTFERAACVECTAEFFAAHKNQFPEDVKYVELSAGEGGAGAKAKAGGGSEGAFNDVC